MSANDVTHSALIAQFADMPGGLLPALHALQHRDGYVNREHIATLADAEPRHQALLGRMALLATKLAREHGADNGFRTVINTGPDGGQEVYHLHMHVMGGPRPWKQG